MATRTTPNGAKVTKVFTMVARKLASDVPLSWLMIRNGSPVRGSMSANWTGASSAEATQVISNAMTKRTAGSGNLLPVVSIQVRARSRNPRPAGASAMECSLAAGERGGSAARRTRAV